MRDLLKDPEVRKTIMDLRESLLGLVDVAERALSMPTTAQMRKDYRGMKHTLAETLMVEIVINGRKVSQPCGNITHEDLTMMAFPNIPPERMHGYTVTVQMGNQGFGMSMSHGDKLFIIPDGGYIFNVANTSNA